MNRYTPKSKEARENNSFVNDKQYDDALRKLGDLEDIEELYYKLLENGKYYKNWCDGDIEEISILDKTISYCIKDKKFIIYDVELWDELEIDKYGKTWALTKEELQQ